LFLLNLLEFVVLLHKTNNHLYSYIIGSSMKLVGAWSSLLRTIWRIQQFCELQAGAQLLVLRIIALFFTIQNDTGLWQKSLTSLWLFVMPH
jgi:hypothetical protein